MKKLKRVANEMIKQDKSILKNIFNRVPDTEMAADIDKALVEIEMLVGKAETDYYAKALHPKNAMYHYGSVTYLALLEEVKRQILNGCRERTSKETVLANARIKVLT